ncbi:MAG: histidine phosphatase family protein, partial [Clostridia bacterium]|nr:histidine phosphatase family protein [Clostridia bacterium]
VRTAAIIAQKQEGCPLITVDPNLSERGTDINYPARVELHKTIYPNLAYTKTSIGTDYHGDAERAEHPLREYVFSPAYNKATEVTEENGTEIRTNPQKILIVAHGAMNAVILSRLVNFRFDVNMNVCQHNTCVNRFRFFLHDGVQRTAFISYNDITHLPPDLRKEY